MKQELPYMVEAKERERLLQAVEFPGKRNRTLLAALLRAVASYPPGKCFVSQDAFARMFKVERKTIQRAFGYLSSIEMNLVAIGLFNRTIGGEPKTLNSYSVNWPALKEIVASQSAANTVGTAGEYEQAKPLGQLGQTVGTFEADRWDSYERPLGHLGPTDGTSDCPTTVTDFNTDFNEQLTTEPVVVEIALNDWTKEQTQQIRAVLVSSGCEGDVNRAIEAAKRRGWSFSKSLAVIACLEPGRPGWLFNWFHINGSWERHLARKSSGGQVPTDRQNHQRGDAMTREQQRRESQRDSVVRHLNQKFLNERGSPATEAEVQAGLKLIGMCTDRQGIAIVLDQEFASCST